MKKGARRYTFERDKLSDESNASIDKTRKGLEDKRVRENRDKLRSALLDLLTRNSFEALTVREISSHAGVGYTTFHNPETGANVVTTEYSDWATNCPEYKVTAVQVSKVTEPSAWQSRHLASDRKQQQLLARSAE